ncbi:DNA polymerase theta-like [Oppia nitens]|uniref:DNA polymerase theta-like n=1 Tax=Oppia nitens TaxID=1686743 RepID=UPI0023DA7DC8|nr:DNA polymerase theta-like [Oppia nitens]
MNRHHMNRTAVKNATKKRQQQTRQQKMVRQPGLKRTRSRSRTTVNHLKSGDSIQINFSGDDSNSSGSHLNNANIDSNLLSNWSFPSSIHRFYARKGITRLFDWQVECLSKSGVLEGRNLVYSAPTSAGKSMVSDILLYKQLLEHKKKAIIILPFVSVTQEKMLSLKRVLRSVGVRVDAFAGGVNPRGGLARVDVAVCTIEKANNMINKLIEDNKLNEIGLIVVDELHMIGSSGRGFLLELLLTKILFMKSKVNHKIQIVGMSATIPNLKDIANWLDSALYVTDFRPVPLYERVCIGDIIYDSSEMNEYRRLDIKDYNIRRSDGTDDTNLVYLAIETMVNSLGALIFCSTKAQCEKLCRTLASNIFELGAGKKIANDKTRDYRSKISSVLDYNKIKELLHQLERCSAGKDPSIEANIRFGVGFHHAGLSMDERAIIEQAFRDGVIKILCATSTLSAGVNLPARLVIIRSPLDFRGNMMDSLTYRQMIGRAGRQGVDTMGESILMCSDSNRQKAEELLRNGLTPINSCLLNTDITDSQSNVSDYSFSGLRRAILEIIANGTAVTYEDISEYISKTFLASTSLSSITRSIIEDILKYLSDEKLIHSLSEGSDGSQQKITPTQFGKAVLASGISPKDGAFILSELNKAKVNLCLANDLHLLYEVTPINLSDQLDSIDWPHYLDIWSKLDVDMRRVGKLVGVSENTILTMIRKSRHFRPEEHLIHKRFYSALALHDLVHEIPLKEVANKFKISKGVLQSMQQNSSSFAGMLTTFCNRLGWHNMEILIEQFQSRLFFGVQRELIDLMRIASLTSNIARILYNKGYDTVVSLANVENVSDIELILMNSGPFDKTNSAEQSVIWLPTLNKAMNVREMVKAIIYEAKELVNKDVGIKVYDLSQASSTDSNPSDRLAEDFSDESNDVHQQPKIDTNFTKLLSQPKKSLIDTNNVKENCIDNSDDSIEDMSFIEQQSTETTKCDNNIINGGVVSPNRSHPQQQSSTTVPTVLSPMDCLSNTSTHHNDHLTESDPRLPSTMSSTPIAGPSHIGRRSHLKLKCGNTSLSFGNIDNNTNTNRVLKDESFGAFTDSLDDISWDRLNCDLNKMNESHSHRCDDSNAAEVSMKDISTLSTDLLANRCPEQEIVDNEDCDTIGSRSSSDHSSKRFSSPSPSGKLAERLNKRPFSVSSDTSVTSEDCFSDSFPPLSDDSLDSEKSGQSDASSVVNKSEFAVINIGDKLNVLTINSSNVSIIDNLLNKLWLKKVLAIDFKVETKNITSVRLIGSRINPRLKSNNDSTLNGLDLGYDNKVMTSVTVNFEGENIVYHIESIDALNKFRDNFKTKLKNESKIVTFDINMCYKVLKICFNLSADQLSSIDWYDVRVGHWVVDPESSRPTSVQQLVKIYCEKYSYLLRTKIVDIDCLSIGLLFPIMNSILTELETKHQLKAYMKTEMSSRLTVSDMELNGLVVDNDYMSKQLDLLEETKRQLEAKAYEISGVRFALSKPHEIAKVLYQDMKLLSNYYDIKKNTKTTAKAVGGGNVRNNRKLPKHLSTSKLALKKLIALTSNPLPQVILDWRKVDYAMKKSIKPVKNYLTYDTDLDLYKIYGLCDDWTSTGRISMHEPNLIGVNKDFTVDDIILDDNDSQQTTVSFSLRQCFISRMGWQLVSADYSQLELRILAHLSKDAKLQEVLNSGGDVFKSIASVWRTKPIDEVTDDERQQSKQICYGMIYGKGEQSLAEDLEITEDEAKEFMESFIGRYEGVKRFITRTVDKCREKGYIETLSGRRRYLSNINSSNSMLRSKAERQAVNSTIQGSAADLVKMAMNSMKENLLNTIKPIECRFVLQMYDELMYEVLERDVQSFVKCLQDSMERCLKNFSVDLPVRVKVGPNWAQLKPIN